MKKLLFVLALMCGFLGANAQEVIVANARSYFYKESTGEEQMQNQFNRPRSFQRGMVFIVKEKANDRFLTDWGWVKAEDTTTETGNNIHSGAFPITNMGGTVLDVTVAGDKITTRGPGLYLTGVKVEEYAPAILFYSSEFKYLHLTGVFMDGKWLIYSYEPSWTNW